MKCEHLAAKQRVENEILKLFLYLPAKPKPGGEGNSLAL